MPLIGDASNVKQYTHDTCKQMRVAIEVVILMDFVRKFDLREIRNANVSFKRVWYVRRVAPKITNRNTKTRAKTEFLTKKKNRISNRKNFN